MTVIKTPIVESYLLEAFRRFLIDTGKRPHLRVDIESVYPHHLSAYADKGTIVFNLSEHSVENFSVVGNVVSFTARFNKISTNVEIVLSGMCILYDPAGVDTTAAMTFDYSEYIATPIAVDKPKSKTNPFKVIDGGKAGNPSSRE